MRKKIIEVEGIFKELKGNAVLINISFHVNEGEILGIIGKSGAGKTTLLRLLVGYLKPNQGTVSYNGKEISKNSKTMRTNIGFLTQENCFYDELSVNDNLNYFGKLYNVSNKNIKINKERLLKFLKLEDKRDSLVGHLSGGMKRRLDFACAMMHNPDILIMDEPTSGLDPILRKEFWKYIKLLNNMGKTIIFSSHHLEELENFCDSVVILKEHKIKEFGSIEDIKEKYEKSYELNLKTKPGNYSKIVSLFEKEKLNVKKYKIFKDKIILFTLNPHDFMMKLIYLLDRLDEKLIEVDMRKPNLNEVFEYYVGEEVI